MEGGNLRGLPLRQRADVEGGDLGGLPLRQRVDMEGVTSGVSLLDNELQVPKKCWEQKKLSPLQERAHQLVI